MEKEIIYSGHGACEICGNTDPCITCSGIDLRNNVRKNDLPEQVTDPLRPPLNDGRTHASKN